MQEVLIDLGLAHLRSRTFATAFLQIFLCAWLRVYLHSLAQWIYLYHPTPNISTAFLYRFDPYVRYLLNRPVTDVAILPYAFSLPCNLLCDVTCVM